MGTATIGAVGSVAGAPRPYDIQGTTKVFIRTITWGGTYATNGDTVGAKTALSLNKIFSIVPIDDIDGYVPQYDRANDKLKMYEAGADGAALDEVANATDLTTTPGSAAFEIRGQ